MGLLISNVLGYGLSWEWWELDRREREGILSEVSAVTSHAKSSGFLKAETYESLRYDCNLIFWLLAGEPKEVMSVKAGLDKSFGKYATARYGFLSAYENKGGKDTKGKDYFVAYPISKSPEWYLLDRGDRMGIMAEHTNMAITDPNNKGINSYTTMSFGIDDNEFVVLYELDSIQDWVLVTQNLRSAKARRWITNEKPILVGHKSSMEILLI